MSKFHLTQALEVFYGKARYARAYARNGRPGVLVTPGLVFHDFGAPEAADADGLINDATSTELPSAETVTYTFPAANVSPTDEVLRTGVFDVPRNVVAVATHGSSIVAMTILVTGLDEYGSVMAELLTITATGTTKTANGLKAFKSITSIAITSAGNAEANSLTVGTGNVLGLPVRVDANGLMSPRGANAADTGTFVPAVTTSPATNVTGDVRGTYAPSTTLNGSNRVAALLKIADPSTKVGAYGVLQFASSDSE